MHPALRNKCLAAAALLAVVLGLSAAQGTSVTTSARVLVGVLVIAAGAWWLASRRQGTTFATAPRMAVVQRTGLSPRTGLALVEIDGKPYLVVHGDGFARISHLRRPTSVKRGRPSRALQSSMQDAELRS